MIDKEFVMFVLALAVVIALAAFVFFGPEKFVEVPF